MWHTLSCVFQSNSNLGCFRPWAFWHHPLTLILACWAMTNSTRLSWHHLRVCLNFKGVGAVVLCQISARKRENPSTDRWSGLENVKQKSYWFMNYPRQAFKTTAGTVVSSVYNHLYFFADTWCTVLQLEALQLLLCLFDLGRRFTIDLHGTIDQICTFSLMDAFVSRTDALIWSPSEIRCDKTLWSPQWWIVQVKSVSLLEALCTLCHRGLMISKSHGTVIPCKKVNIMWYGIRQKVDRKLSQDLLNSDLNLNLTICAKRCVLDTAWLCPLSFLSQNASTSQI